MVEGGAGFSGSPLQKRWFLSSLAPIPLPKGNGGDLLILFKIATNTTNKLLLVCCGSQHALREGNVPSGNASLEEGHGNVVPEAHQVLLCEIK
jgi:hypothetical protein